METQASRPVQQSFQFMDFPAPSKAAGSIAKQTGWKRPHPQMICQDSDVLLAIKVFDFDLDDKVFLKYLRNRIGMTFECAKPELLLFMLTDPKADIWIIESPGYRYLNGTIIPFGKDRELKLKRFNIQKGKIQDCWELFKQQEKCRQS